ncbi:MAG TPA: SPOR domain-containing protein, partial [Prevotella sp.]
MLEIERHIEILLLNNDCVIIPGFGGFMAHHVEARFDEGDDVFLPPSRTVGFNPQLKLNDSLLAQSYIEV